MKTAIISTVLVAVLLAVFQTEANAQCWRRYHGYGFRPRVIVRVCPPPVRYCPPPVAYCRPYGGYNAPYARAYERRDHDWYEHRERRRYYR